MRKFMAHVSIILILLTFFISSHPVQASNFGWGYKKNPDHKVPDIGKYQTLLDQYGAYYADQSGGKNIYLTFDNGYEQGYTSDILAVLKKHQVPATFFITGHYVETAPALVKQMVEEGHIIGNHSYHHPDFTVMSKQSIQEELETLEKAVAAISEQKELKYLRPPRGVFNEQTLQWSNELGYIHIFWSLAFNDWQTDKQKGAQYAYDQIMKQIHPGAIVLLHAVSSDNAEALEKVIIELKKQGYAFKSLDEFVMRDMIPTGIYGF